MLGAKLFYAPTKHGELAKCSCVLPVHTRLSVYTIQCPIILRKEACVMLWALLEQSNCLLKHEMFALCLFRSPFEKCAPWGKLSSWLCSASHEYIALASLQRKRKQVMSWQVLRGSVGFRETCGRWSHVFTAPSNRNRLGRRGIFKKQRSGSDPETAWKQKCSLELIIWGYKKKNKTAGNQNCLVNYVILK